MVLRMKHPEAAEELRQLASNYESLAEWQAHVPDASVEKGFTLAQQEVPTA